MAVVLSSNEKTITHQLPIKQLFDGLTTREKLYAHHMSRAAWYGSKIILRQTSPEGPGIFDFIMQVHKACSGDWQQLVRQDGITSDDIDNFLSFAGLFLSNLGNYFGNGNTKVVPNISVDALWRMGQVSLEAQSTLRTIIEPMLSLQPGHLGFATESSQSNYYPSVLPISKDEITEVSQVMEQNSIEPENTRVRKEKSGSDTWFEVLQASATEKPIDKLLAGSACGSHVIIRDGDHATELVMVCAALSEAVKYAADERQISLLNKYIETFSSGNLQAYRESQQVWVSDVNPRVDNILGFVECYRDPHGVRAEWEGAVFISDPEETTKLEALVNNATMFIRKLPWAERTENDGKGPFEPTRFRAPGFSVVHSLAFCTSEVWEGVNLPNYSDIREIDGLKNIVFANRMGINHHLGQACLYVHPTEAERFRICIPFIRFVVTAVHELLGHGTGKLLSETGPGSFNFDQKNPPRNPLNGRAIETWYKMGKTWTGVFGQMATSVEECRAMLISYFFADDAELLSIFGYDEASEITADELTYYIYIHIGVEGIKALRSFDADTKTWGQAHNRANFTILKHLLEDAGGVLCVESDEARNTIHVRVNRTMITSHGKPSLSRMLCRLHIWRCIADVDSCTELYENLSVVEKQYEIWRRIVVSHPEPRWKFVQPNTFQAAGGDVELKVYEESNEGIIQSFVDRSL